MMLDFRRSNMLTTHKLRGTWLQHLLQLGDVTTSLQQMRVNEKMLLRLADSQSLRI